MIASGSDDPWSGTPSSYGVYLMVRFSGRLRGTLALCDSVAFSPDGSMIASGGGWGQHHQALAGI
jgi:hypothetical protein